MAEMDQLFEQIDDIEIAMLTTRRPDGHLCSRAMATQKRAAGADLWFVTLEDSGKLAEVAFDPHVNLSYYKDRTREWVSVSGIATISKSPTTTPGIMKIHRVVCQPTAGIRATAIMGTSRVPTFPPAKLTANAEPRRSLGNRSAIIELPTGCWAALATEAPTRRTAN